MMTNLMNKILERVLSEELGRQTIWLEDDKRKGFDVSSREEVIKQIKFFMEQEDIKFRDDYYFSAISNS